VSKGVQNTGVIKQGVGVCLLGQTWNFACGLPEKVCSHHGKVLCCTSQQTEATAGLQTLRQAFERNLVFLQSNARWWPLHTKNWQIFTLKL
jgi:hypothetical protein